MQVENGVELPARSAGETGIGFVPVEIDSFLQAIKIRRAVRASLDVLFDLPVRRSAQLVIELLLDVARDFTATRHMSVKAVHGMDSKHSGAARSSSVPTATDTPTVLPEALGNLESGDLLSLLRRKLEGDVQRAEAEKAGQQENRSEQPEDDRQRAGNLVREVQYRNHDRQKNADDTIGGTHILFHKSLLRKLVSALVKFFSLGEMLQP